MEKNYIVTTPVEDDTNGLETLAWADLYAANFNFNRPFCLRLIDNQYIICHQVARILPRKRMVVFGTWQGKPMVAKLFYDPTNAKRHVEKDVAGVKALQKNKIPTPALLYQGTSEDNRIEVVIFERIMNSANLEDVWRAKQSLDQVMPILKVVLIEIATQHVLGLMQQDLHLRNFLLTEKRVFTPPTPIDEEQPFHLAADNSDDNAPDISEESQTAAAGIAVYTLDGAQIKESSHLLAKSASMNNLALFLSQLGVNLEPYQEELFKFYADARGWSLKPADTAEIFILIRKWTNHRWQEYSRKIFRNSSHFVRVDKWTSVAMYNRLFEGPELKAVIDNPESAFTMTGARLLKAGNSATVMKITLDGRELVIKRYNLKSFWHRARRCLRATRAKTCWRLAQKLFLFNIPTPMPIAFIENRVLGFRGTSYLITEYVPGEHAGDFFHRNLIRNDKTSEMIQRISVLLKSVAKVEITHGDLKITNILVNQQEQPVLIDLDGAAEHLSISSLHKAWRRELQRFLANFHSNPAVYRQFEIELEKW